MVFGDELTDASQMDLNHVHGKIVVLVDRLQIRFLEEHQHLGVPAEGTPERFGAVPVEPDVRVVVHADDPGNQPHVQQLLVETQLEVVQEYSHIVEEQAALLEVQRQTVFSLQTQLADLLYQNAHCGV